MHGVAHLHTNFITFYGAQIRTRLYIYTVSWRARICCIYLSYPICIFVLYLQELQGRACDDLDMEQALKTDGLCTPDVIKSALDHKSEGSKISETTIDSLFGAPDKIYIPERYIPDTVRKYCVCYLSADLLAS